VFDQLDQSITPAVVAGDTRVTLAAPSDGSAVPPTHDTMSLSATDKRARFSKILDAHPDDTVYLSREICTQRMPEASAEGCKMAVWCMWQRFGSNSIQWVTFFSLKPSFKLKF